MVNSNRIGSSDTMVASSVVLATVPGDEIAGRHAAVADAAGDRRAQFGELDVERRLANRRLVCRDRCLRAAERLGPLLEHLLGDGAVAREQPATLEVGLGKGQVGLGLREIGACLRQRVLERPLVDGEQEIALLDHLAVAEMHLVEIAGDAGADLDRVDGHEPSDIFVEVGHRALHRLRHRHGGRRRAGGRLALAAAGQRQRDGQQGSPGSGKAGNDHEGCAASNFIMLQRGKGCRGDCP